MDRPPPNPLKRVLDDPEHEQPLRFFRAMPEETLTKVRWDRFANMQLGAIGPFFEDQDGDPPRNDRPESAMSFEDVQSPASVHSLDSPSPPENGTKAVQQSEAVDGLQVDQNGRPLPLHSLSQHGGVDGITGPHGSSSSATAFASASGAPPPPPPPPAPAYATPVRHRPNNNARASMPQKPTPTHFCMVDLESIQDGTQQSGTMFSALARGQSGTYRFQRVHPGSSKFYIFLELGPSCTGPVPGNFQQAQAGPSRQHQAPQQAHAGPSRPHQAPQQAHASPSRPHQASWQSPFSNQAVPQNSQKAEPAASRLQPPTPARPTPQINLHLPESCRNGHSSDCKCKAPLPPITGTLHLPEGTSQTQTVTELRSRRGAFPSINIVQFVDSRDPSEPSQYEAPPMFIPLNIHNEGELVDRRKRPVEEEDDDELDLLPETPFDWEAYFPVPVKKDTGFVPASTNKNPLFHERSYQEALEKGEFWKTAGLRFLQIIPTNDNEWNRYARTNRDVLNIYELVTFHNHCSIEDRAALSFVELLRLAVDKIVRFAGNYHAVRLFTYVFLGVASLSRVVGTSMRTLEPLLHSYFENTIRPDLVFDRYNLTRMLLSVKKMDNLIDRCRKVLGNRCYELPMYIHNPQDIFIDFNESTEEFIMERMNMAHQPEIHIPSSDVLDLKFLIWKFVGGECRNGGKLVPEPIDVEDDDYLIDEEMPYPANAAHNSFDSLVEWLTEKVYDKAEESAHWIVMDQIKNREKGLEAAYSLATAEGHDVTMMMN